MGKACVLPALMAVCQMARADMVRYAMPFEVPRAPFVSLPNSSLGSSVTFEEAACASANRFTSQSATLIGDCCRPAFRLPGHCGALVHHLGFPPGRSTGTVLDVPFSSAAGRHSGEAALFEIPPPPGGDVLTLSGLVTVAGLTWGRSARSGRTIRFNGLSEWCHERAAQIGDRVPFEFRCHPMPPQLAAALPVTEAKGDQDWHYPSERDGLIRVSQLVPLSATPRGPPGHR